MGNDWRCEPSALRCILARGRRKLQDFQHALFGSRQAIASVMKQNAVMKGTQRNVLASMINFRRVCSDSMVLEIRRQRCIEIVQKECDQELKLPVEEIRTRWRRKQIAQQKQQYIWVESSWRLKQMSGNLFIGYHAKSSNHSDQLALTSSSVASECSNPRQNRNLLCCARN